MGYLLSHPWSLPVGGSFWNFLQHPPSFQPCAGIHDHVLDSYSSGKLGKGTYSRKPLLHVTLIMNTSIFTGFHRVSHKGSAYNPAFVPSPFKCSSLSNLFNKTASYRGNKQIFPPNFQRQMF